MADLTDVPLVLISPSNPPLLLTLLLLVGEMLCQLSHISVSFRFSPSIFAFVLGFLPVIYTWLTTRRNPSPVFLPSESDEDEQFQTKPVPSSQELRGWKLLLLWFPAVCDLTGTTVRNFLFLFSSTFHYYRSCLIKLFQR